MIYIDRLQNNFITTITFLSPRKIKTTFDIIEMEKCKNHTNRGTEIINMDGNVITNQQKIAHSFNNYFLIVGDKITSNMKNYKTTLNFNNSTHTHTHTLSG